MLRRPAGDMAQQVIQRLLDRAASAPGAEALREIDTPGQPRVLTYSQLAGATLALADQVRANCDDESVVLISYPNQLEYAVAFLGVLAAGGAAFPLHPRLTDQERVTAARRSGAVAILGTDEAAAGLKELGVRRLAADGAALGKTPTTMAARSSASERARLFLQSSGTTGPPKIVERSAAAIDAVARNVAETVPLGPDDRVLGLVPACHAYGVESVVLGPIWAGSCIHLCRQVSAALVTGRGNEPPATVFPGVPFLFEMLSSAGDASAALLRGIRRAYSAGATLPRSVSEAFHRRFGRRIGQLFGMTEVGSVTFQDGDAADHDPESVGSPMPGVCLRIVDPRTGRLDDPRAGLEGEVAVSTPSMMTGYLRDDAPICDPPNTLRDGFFLTGDLGRLDARSRLTLTGRAKLIVDIGGLKVNLIEVEQAICRHPGVGECVVAPVPLTETVSRLKAYVIPRGGAAISPDELRAFLRPKLSAHKIPRSFELRDSFPRSASGKVLRHQVGQG